MHSAGFKGCRGAAGQAVLFSCSWPELGEPAEKERDQSGPGPSALSSCRLVPSSALRSRKSDASGETGRGSFCVESCQSDGTAFATGFRADLRMHPTKQRCAVLFNLSYIRTGPSAVGRCGWPAGRRRKVCGYCRHLPGEYARCCGRCSRCCIRQGVAIQLSLRFFQKTTILPCCALQVPQDPAVPVHTASQSIEDASAHASAQRGV